MFWCAISLYIFTSSAVVLLKKESYKETLKCRQFN